MKREVSFSMVLPVKEVYSHIDAEGEPVLIQGMIDCLFETDGKLYLLDYKTDRVQGRYTGGLEAAVPILKKRYETQIALCKKSSRTFNKQNIRGEKFFISLMGI
ncbi:hypothetical protein BsIDN1_19580 [Bacillus safensis]|uniref:Uncharacterized protein n=1 Tax=Bacillus safensis TaxID=561879 RepID=A0A5S9M426_BACIA|nr:hypothetical protein BsIDN1_19580 [Bacillus safensis]